MGALGAAVEGFRGGDFGGFDASLCYVYSVSDAVGSGGRSHGLGEQRGPGLE